MEPITEIVNAHGTGDGGTEVTSYAPAATYITNKQRAFIFNQTEIGIADFSKDDVV